MSTSNAPRRSSGGSRPCGTWFILTIPHDKWSPCLPAGVCYVKGQLELAESGFRHWQLVACTSGNARPTSLKTSFCREAHVELTRSAAALDYVWKEQTRVADTQFELGTRPFRRSSNVDWESVWNLARLGDFLAIPASIRVQNYNSLRRIRSDYAAPAAIVRTCVVFHGPTGSGKSRRAWDEAGWGAYPKNPTTKFW